MLYNKCNIKENDKVRVIVGKDKGKVGKVLKVINKSRRILVKNVNLVKKHVKPSANNKQGGIVEREASVHFSNVMLLCSKCVKAVRIKKRVLEDGSKVRICGKCNEVIDK